MWVFFFKCCFWSRTDISDAFFGGKKEFGFENSVVWMDLNLLRIQFGFKMAQNGALCSKMEEQFVFRWGTVF